MKFLEEIKVYYRITSQLPTFIITAKGVCNVISAEPVKLGKIG